MNTPFRKIEVLEAFRNQLKHELGMAIAASKDAASYATDEESRAESQWDTQGLEASYLAAGQAGQAREWVKALQSLQACWQEWQKPMEKIRPGAVFQCELAGDSDWYFLVSTGGGQDFEVESLKITTITLQSPMAAQVAGKTAGQSFQLANGLPGKVFKVI
jgi:transcription elongation GreA/GreB family factor